MKRDGVRSVLGADFKWYVIAWAILVLASIVVVLGIVFLINDKKEEVCYMTTPRGVNPIGREPGESEYSHGKGLQPPPRTGATRFNVTPEDWTPTVYEQGKAIQRTDSTYADAVADPAAKPRTKNNTTDTQWQRVN